MEDLRACFSVNAPDGAAERAELTLKILRQGTSRMSGENNRVAIALKVAKAAGIAPSEQQVLWQQIAASGEGLLQSPSALAPAESAA